MLLESSAEAQPKRREMNQTDTGRTEDRANHKGKKKNQIYVVRSVMVETKLMVAFF